MEQAQKKRQPVMAALMAFARISVAIIGASSLVTVRAGSVCKHRSGLLININALESRVKLCDSGTDPARRLLFLGYLEPRFGGFGRFLRQGLP